MKIKNKGKVYPSPSSSSSSSSSSLCSNAAGGGGDYLSVLKLLPAAIIALVSVLPLDDRDVLAYLIMRSIKTTTTTTTSPSPPSFSQKKLTKKTPNNTTSGGGGGGGLYCDCFDCYTSFWFRWDSSPNRELIHQAIEAFEDHLTSGESEKSKKNAKAKRRDKTARRSAASDSQPIDVPGPGQPESSVPIKPVEVIEQSSASQAGVASPENEVASVGSPEKVSSAAENEVAGVFNGSPPPEAEKDVVWTAAVAAVTTQHKGLARKVLPDVLGLFNSRLWSLWSPNV